MNAYPEREVADSPNWYWNSNTRFNNPVKVLGANGENYAVESEGHVYVVPKRNISSTAKIFVTTAPKPEEVFWFSLTPENRDEVLRYGYHFSVAAMWVKAAYELLTQPHTNTYTYEWFYFTPRLAEEIIAWYGYEKFKSDKHFESCLPTGPSHKMLVRQLWEEKNRRDGIVPA